MSKTAAEMIDPCEVSRRISDLKRPLFDEHAVARADEALTAMSGNFQQWIDEEIAKLQAARLAADNQCWSFRALEGLFGAAHDLKGLGTTYGYPLVTHVAASLCRMIETDAGRALANADPTLARAHVDAIRAAVRDQIRTEDHPVGAALIKALEQKVESLGVAPA